MYSILNGVTVSVSGLGQMITFCRRLCETMFCLIIV